MTAEQLHDALTLLPADLVAAAEKRRSRKTQGIHWQRWAAMAACFAILICAGSFCMLLFAPKGATESMADMEAAAAAPESPAEVPAAAPEAAEDFSAAERENGGMGTTAQMQQPPQLRVESGSQSLTMAAAGYTWEIPQEDGSALGICADIPAPTDHPERHPRLTAETEAVDLHWEIAPQSVTARCWPILEPDSAVNGAAKDAELIGQTLALCPGAHIYEITAQWENGTATYVLLVNTLR